MNRQLPRRSWTQLAAATLLAGSLVGCASPGNHAKWKAEANDRYLTVRTALMLDMAQQQFKTGQLDVAHKTVKDALEADPANPELYLLAGRIALERGELERSYRLLDQSIQARAAAVIKHKPSARPKGDDGKPMEKQQALEEVKDPDKAAKIADRPKPFYYQGVVLQRWQRYQQALDKYNRAYELEKDNPSYLLAASEMLVSMDRITQAQALLSSKLRYFDQNSGIRTGLGHIYNMKNQPDKAAEMFRQASLLDPDSPQLKESLAMAQLDGGHLETGAATIEGLLKTPEMADRDDLRRELAGAQTKLGNLSKARDIYAELTRRNPANLTDWIKLGELAWRKDDLGGTLMAAHRVITLAPDRHEGYLLAGLVWNKRGRLDDALQMFDRAAKQAPGSAMPLVLRGVALQKAGRPAAAAKAYQAALDREPEDPQATRLLRSLANAMP